MTGVNSSASSIYARRLRVRSYTSGLRLWATAFRFASDDTLPREVNRDGGHGESIEGRSAGAMSRRLQDLSDQSLETGGSSALRNVRDAGFSEDLKRTLEKKIADAGFRSEHASAFTEINLPASAGKGTRDIAGAQPWTGIERVEDAALRMLSDVHKPLRTKPKTPHARGPPTVDTGRSKSRPSAGARLAGAREGASAYAMSKDQEQGLTDEERERFRQQMKARFQPGARQVAATITGLQSLANQRIEDAIARGQFKNLSDRGKKIERDHNANNPFIDTTEYFMNKMIKKQEIVPPWIEKQQEVTSTANTFRKRLRSDWKRHVSRVIASRGGDLESQVNSAEEYAVAEIFHNPTKMQVDSVNDNGHMTEISMHGKRKPFPTDDDDDDDDNAAGGTHIEYAAGVDNTSHSPAKPTEMQAAQQLSSAQAPPFSQAPRRVIIPPFRDSEWERTEKSYHTLAIQNLNSLTRSYNLMAPDLAKKPYFSLERELRSCFADVAPQIAATIRERALASKIKGVEVIGHKPGGVLERFSFGKPIYVHDDLKPFYGFREMWRDLFSTKR